jgi:thiol-disulfide isomerase/thioredoxin
VDVICPKCGYRQEAGGECLRCGVVFAKAAPREPSFVGRPPAAVRRPSPPLLAWLVPVLVVALLGAWLGRRPSEPGAGALAEPPPLEAAGPDRPGGDGASEGRAESETSDLPDPSAEDAEAGSEPPPDGPPPPAPGGPPDDSAGAFRPAILDDDWHRGAAGFERAHEQAAATGQPLLVYFYTDWCPYCRELDRELLADARVAEYTRELIKVRINPERGAAERALADRYGITGYPSLFLHPRGLGEPTKIRRQVRDGGDRRLRTPDEFVATLRSAAG